MSRVPPRIGIADSVLGESNLTAEEQDHVLSRVLPPAAAATGAARADTKLIDARVLEEEVAFLWEEQAETRQVDLLLVGFDLREIRVDGEVPRQARCHAVLHIHAGIEISKVGARTDATGARQRVRLDAQVVAGLQALKAFNRSRQRNARKTVNPLHGRPEAVLVQPAQSTLKIDPPRLERFLAELQRAEGNSNLGVPAILADARLHVPHAVPVAVLVTAFVGHLRVPLRARWVHGELITVPLVVKRVDHHLKVIAVTGVEVLAELVDDDLVRLIVLGKHANEQRVIVVEQLDLGVEGRWLAFARVVLDEVLGDRRRQPGGFIETSVEFDRTRRSRRDEFPIASWPCCSRLGCRRRLGRSHR